MLCYSMSSVSAHYTTKGTVRPKCLMWADKRANASTVECSGIVIVNSQQMCMSPYMTSTARDGDGFVCVWCFRSWFVMSEWTMGWTRHYAVAGRCHGNTIRNKLMWCSLVSGAISSTQRKSDNVQIIAQSIFAAFTLLLLLSCDSITDYMLGCCNDCKYEWTKWHSLHLLCGFEALGVAIMQKLKAESGAVARMLFIYILGWFAKLYLDHFNKYIDTKKIYT